jgi:cell division protein FtsI/penicillin-binding protein 2
MPIAAAALATGMVETDTQFHCTGAYGKYRFVCWRRSGHGHISATQAFAFSCNIAFAEMAKRLSAPMIERFARRLGLAQPIGWSSADDTHNAGQDEFRQLPEEQAGMVFADRTSVADEGAIIQTAIGQRDVLLSPLQAANMVATLLNDGRLQAPRTVREIRYRDGQLRETFAPQVLRPADAEFRRIAPILRGWMRETVRSGTAQALSRSPHLLAGKTGTAQVTVGDRTSKSAAVHQWFVGYDAADERFAVAVVVKHVHPHARQLALPLAARVFDILLSVPVEQAP